MFILTDKTPNPEALKFTPHVRLTGGGSYAYARGAPLRPASALAARLLALDSVAQVFITEDFVTVTRDPAGESWATLKIQVIAALGEHMESGEPAVSGEATGEEETAEGQVESEIRQVLGLYVRPGVARDGGEIRYERFDHDTGVLWIRMEGACGGCPSSRLTLKAGVEQIVKRYVPEVSRVEEAVAEPEPAASEARQGRLKGWVERLRETPSDPARRPVFSHGGRAFRRDS